MFCPKCGKKLPNNAGFCTACGKKIPNTNDQPAEAESKPRRIRPWRIALGCAILLAALIGFPFAAYFSKMSKLTVYEHPAKFFSFVYPKSLKLETPPLPPEAGKKCTQAPCLIVLKNPSFNDYVTNLIAVATPDDEEITKDKFYSKQLAGAQEMVSAGIATVETVNNQRVYKITNDSDKAASVISAMSKSLGYDSVQSVYLFITDNFIAGILIRKAPPGAPANYNGFLDLTSLKLQ